MHLLKHVHHALLCFVFHAFLITLILRHRSTRFAKSCLKLLVCEEIFCHYAANLPEVLKRHQPRVLLEWPSRVRLDWRHIVREDRVLVEGYPRMSSEDVLGDWAGEDEI